MTPLSAPNAENITRAETKLPPHDPTSASNVSAATRVDAITRSIGKTDRYTTFSPT